MWCFAAYIYHSKQQNLRPQAMAKTVSKDLAGRENALARFLKNDQLLDRIFTDSLSGSDAGNLEDLPFYFFAFNNDSLTYWNTNEALASCDDKNKAKNNLLHNPKGVFLKQCITLSKGRTLTVLFPIVITYPVENDYLSSHFVASAAIPVSSQLTVLPLIGSLPIYSNRAKPVCYLLVHKEDIQPYAPDNSFIILISLAVLASVSWIHLMMIYLSKRRSPVAGFTGTVVLIVILRLVTYIWGLPFGIGNLTVFSPALYASSSFLPSLGDLLLNTLCLLWIIVFLVRHLPYKQAIVLFKDRKWRLPFATFIIVLITAYSFSFVNIIRSLVLDSNISFDVSHFYFINTYTILGLFTIAILTAISCIIIYILNLHLNHYIESKLFKYLLVVILGLAFALPAIAEHELFYSYLACWLLLFIILLDVQGLELSSDLFTPHMIFWAAFVCLFCTGLLQYFNHQKEREIRKKIAEQGIDTQRDNQMEYTFSNIAQNIKRDKIFRAFFYKPTLAGRKQINEYFDANYLTGQLNKYQAKVFLFDEHGHNLYNKDTTSYSDLETEKNESAPLLANGLYYNEYAANNYLAAIRLENDTTNATIGHAYIRLIPKKTKNETVYPELLQPAATRNSLNEPEFAYAVYEDGKLMAHSNDYPFPDYIKQGSLPVNKYVFKKGNNASELWYSYNDRKTIIVVHLHNLFIESITLFSYLFGIEVLMAVFLLVYQFYLSYFLRPEPVRKLRLTLRKRIHLSMLLIVLLSFLIIGIVTIAFFTNQYKTNNKTKLESAMQTVQQSIQQYLKQNKSDDKTALFDSISHSTKFKLFITNLANDQKIDINIFAINGGMEVTSQEDIYDGALLARLIRPDAFYQLNNLNRSLVIQNEEIGDLSYLSGYAPAHDQDGTLFGYINIPYLSSEKELNFQISNIVVTLINLYAFIFLLSSFFTVFISRWLTGSLNIIIAQFGRLNLQRNERINWPYNDEIGMLVKEYNNMVQKLEENAIILAQSERESAWREMARQVAHEIKNPLTPMRLNIQHLQQALRNNYPNARELAQKVSDSLIEQIDNLSYIASEFSNFAKMPEARPEKVDVNALVDNAMELYVTDSNTAISLKKYSEPLWVYSDKSQLLRVLTNLLENAKQAIPPGRAGHIEVKVDKEDRHAIISVADNGAGISEAVRKRIFQPYFTTKSSGTGLGLTMTKKIIEFSNGDIWFETEEGKGTTFFIKLPLVHKD